MVLASLVLLLDAPQRPDPVHVRSWFYTLLNDVGPELHDDHKPPPFTLGVGGKAAGYWLRLTLLDQALYAALSPSLYTLSGQCIPLGEKSILVKGVLQQGHPWAGLSTYPRLFQGEVASDLSLQFVSPTFFKRKGAHYPLPEPALVFGSLLERFRAYAPAAPPDTLCESLTRLTLRHTSIRPHPIEHGVRAVGFAGQATFHLSKAGEEELRWLGALWRFTFFAGVGAKTSLGFGQTRPYTLKREETRHDQVNSRSR